uniref:MSHA biogenesis protein MshK n=1 Tax=Vibrio ziniensis TaxID=2711221 RepID=A0A6G7CMF9_9VIBR|nr:MSHA biogenesis protein MshK [Vibrio ziniensis]
MFATFAVASQEQDPTAPLGWAKKEPVQKVRKVPVPELQSIVCKNNSQCYAILNDKVVEKGNSVSGYKVSNVTASQVELKQGNKSWTLKLFSLDVKK